MDNSKYTQCRKCYGKNMVNGKEVYPKGYILTKLASGETALEKCDCLKRWQEQNSLKNRLKKSNIPVDAVSIHRKSFTGKNTQSSIERLVRYAEQIAKDSQNRDKVKSAILYIYGPFGTQKTTAAYYLGKKLLQGGNSVQYLLMNTLAGMLTKSTSYSADDSLIDEIERLKNKDVLILDESFDKEKMVIFSSSKTQVSLIDSFLRERLTSGKGTVFISNKQISEITDNMFSQALQNLLTRETTKFQSVFYFGDVYDKVRPDELFF